MSSECDLQIRQKQWFTDILENIERIETYVKDHDAASFEEDEKTRDAVERCLSRLIEAASRLDRSGYQFSENNSIYEIQGMGNFLRHQYDQVLESVLWETIQKDLPLLKEEALSSLNN